MSYVDSDVRLTKKKGGKKKMSVQCLIRMFKKNGENESQMLKTNVEC